MVDTYLAWLNVQIAINHDLMLSEGHPSSERRLATARHELLERAKEQYLKEVSR